MQEKRTIALQFGFISSPDYNYMFELHLGEGLSIQSTELSSPLLVLGKSGQGKSVFLMNLVLELIKNGQKGYLYDPFGDIALKVKAQLKAPEVLTRVEFVSHDDSATIAKALNEKFVLIRGDMLDEGSRKANDLARPLLKSILAAADATSWIIIDEAFGMIDDELFGLYLSKSSPQLVLGATELVGLSAKERSQLFKATKNIALYKPRELDAKWLEENYSELNAKDIGAIQQYHFQFLHNEKLTYAAAPWPLPKL